MTVLGILGGGQLGRMTAMAAARLGIRSLIFDPDPACCASQVSAQMVGDFDDLRALQKFAGQTDAITLEFENIPAASVHFLAGLRPMRPSADFLETCQDRLREKNWLCEQGLRVAPYQDIASASALGEALQTSSSAQFLKTRRLGYDGKGQIQLQPESDAQAAWTSLGEVPCLLEERVDFAREVSLIIARNASGEYAHLPLVENQHENLRGGGKILRTTLAPAQVSEETRISAERIGKTVADASQLVGVLALEMFLLENGKLLVNEMAPRPHNSGHWSIEGASVSQFELLVRAACDLPLPKHITARPSRMRNLLAQETEDLKAILQEQEAYAHIYGKGQAKDGRKMGHLTYVDVKPS